VAKAAAILSHFLEESSFQEACFYNKKIVSGILCMCFQRREQSQHAQLSGCDVQINEHAGTVTIVTSRIEER
jgi:hypothetical protein